MTRTIKKFVYVIITMLLSMHICHAGGISVDAGLTPGQDRWILRIQYRYMEEYNPNMNMQNQMLPLMVAYGVNSNFTFLARIMYVKRTIEMNEKQYSNGLNDPGILLKFKVYRKNTAEYVLGIAPFVATNIPVGSSDISRQIWNPEIGVSISYRPRFWSFDFTTSYNIGDITDKIENQASDLLSLNIAFSTMIPIKTSDVAISPVLEFTYNNEINSSIQADMKKEVLFISPGFMFIKSSIALELLYQYPIYQQEQMQVMRSEPRFIAGFRYMY